MTEIRHGNRNRRNLYAGPTEQDHFAVTVGPIEHAAAMSAFLADAAKAYIAAGHPMPEPPVDEHLATIAETVRLLREAGVHEGNGLPARVQNLIGERDQLKARIDEAVRRWPFRLLLGVLMGSQEVADEYLAALQGDQPAEPASTQASPQQPSVQASGEATGGDR